jgi:aryl-alcohol dehydrogenase-like predicted oxidoreductase
MGTGDDVEPRRLGRCGIEVSPIGFGAFKIGRNRKIKYAQSYELPGEEQVSALLNGLLDAGVNLVDTAPAYGLSEERIGRAIAHRRHEFILSTKVGETFENGVSSYDYSGGAIRASFERSRERLQTSLIDVLLIHSNGEDLKILEDTDAAAALIALREAGDVRAIGFSGKTVEGAERALEWADVLMVEYHPDDQSHHDVIGQAAAADVGVLVKKPLASGRLAPEQAIPFILRHEGVGSVVVGGLDLQHLRENVRLAARCSG